MPTIKAQVVLPAVTAIAEDAVTNTFHFNSGAASPADFASIHAKLVDFYNTNGAVSLESIAKYLSPTISRAASACRIKQYVVVPGPDGPPDFEDTFTLDPAGVQFTLPREVAACLSFYAGPNRARYRGRVYIGPLTTAGSTNGPSVDARPDTALIDTLRDAAVRLLGGVDTNNWAVYSGVDAVSRVVTGGWVDNAFDTQRRRGVKASARTLWGDAPT